MTPPTLLKVCWLLLIVYILLCIGLALKQELDDRRRLRKMRERMERGQ